MKHVGWIWLAIGLCAFICCAGACTAQKPGWRQATASELSALLPARALVEGEHIETEMRTASGVVDESGHALAGVVLLTAGYSADGKYSHFLLVQLPVKIGATVLAPGPYVLGWTRTGTRDSLTVHLNQASTGKLVATAEARRISEPLRLESLHIWPPQDRSMLQIGRFALNYQVVGP